MSQVNTGLFDDVPKGPCGSPYRLSVLQTAEYSPPAREGEEEAASLDTAIVNYSLVADSSYLSSHLYSPPNPADALDAEGDYVILDAHDLALPVKIEPN